ncbi:MAG: outer membrane protein assembly factor BamD [Candidatus Omnitrophica bacterium]|nr:outer membrane protein assembly factor BamD [Candidatus Omnitrophota bacterium]
MNIKTILRVFVLALVVGALNMGPAHAFWIWTPESGKWVNPKYSVKESPAEQLQYADGFFDAKQYAEAMREYKKLLKQYPKAREAAEAQFNIGRSWEELKKYNQAVQAYQMVVDKYPFSDLGPKVIEREYVIANLLMEGKVKDSQLAESLLGTEHKVVEIFRKVIKNDPYGTYAPSSQYKIGLYYQARGEYQEARDEFEKTLNDYPDSKWAESARYQIALSDAKRSVKAQYDQKVTGTAVQGFEDFVKTHPESELSKDAQDQVKKLRDKEAENNYLVAEYYWKNRKYSSAKTYYTLVVEKYDGTIWALRSSAKLKTIPVGTK